MSGKGFLLRYLSEHSCSLYFCMSLDECRPLIWWPSWITVFLTFWETWAFNLYSYVVPLELLYHVIVLLIQLVLLNIFSCYFIIFFNLLSLIDLNSFSLKITYLLWLVRRGELGMAVENFIRWTLVLFYVLVWWKAIRFWAMQRVVAAALLLPLNTFSLV